MTGRIKFLPLLCGAATLIVATIATDGFVMAADEKKIAPVEVVNTPLDVNVVDDQAVVVLGPSDVATKGGVGISVLTSNCQETYGPSARMCLSLDCAAGSPECFHSG